MVKLYAIKDGIQDGGRHVLNSRSTYNVINLYVILCLIPHFEGFWGEESNVPHGGFTVI